MKAEELMIGDWVMCTYQSINKPVKVMEIKTVADDELKVLICDNWVRLVFSMKYIEPIPLSPEILEKNGFEKVLDNNKIPTYRMKWPRNPDYYFTVWTGLDCYWNPIGFGVTIGGVQGNIDYVHQLQHALRLCRINIKIEL